MGSSQSDDGQKTLPARVVAVLQRLSFIMSEPHESIQGTRKRQQTRMLSILLLVAVLVFIYETITTTNPIYAAANFVAIILALICYYLSRTKFSEYTLKLSLTLITYGPPVILLYGAVVDSAILDNLLIWFSAALIIGTLLTNPRIVFLQGVTVFILMIVGVYAHGFSFLEFGTAFGSAAIIIILMVVCSYMLEDYINKEIKKSAEVNRQRWELEVYTQLLRHDLRNDLQAVMNCLELAEMTLEINKDLTHDHMDTALEIGNSMVRLLSTFSMPIEIPSTELVRLIIELANRAEKNHPGLKVMVTSTEESREQSFTASRLMPMVWNNIFRNTAAYAGEAPTITVDISIHDDEFLISVADDGPGIPEEEKEWLFKRGKGTTSKERGLGLYLAKVVIESHHGSIELIDSEIGTKFDIRLPTEASL
jgi:signal transduction histidine kinase